MNRTTCSIRVNEGRGVKNENENQFSQAFMSQTSPTQNQCHFMGWPEVETEATLAPKMITAERKCLLNVFLHHGQKMTVESNFR